MKGDKRQGGKLAIAAKGFNATYEASIGDIHYTLMCYTAATGEPVMVVVMFAAKSRDPGSHFCHKTALSTTAKRYYFNSTILATNLTELVNPTTNPAPIRVILDVFVLYCPPKCLLLTLFASKSSSFICAKGCRKRSLSLVLGAKKRRQH